MPKEPKKKTAEKILEAADELLAEAGFGGASVGAIAKRAGVNKALVFYHFASKEALFVRVLERYYTAQLEALNAAFAMEGTPRERLAHVVRSYVDFMHENRRYPRLVQQLTSAGTVPHAQIQKNLRPLFEWTTAALKDLAPAEGPLAAKQFFVTFSNMVTGYFVNAPVLEGMWGEDPVSDEALEARKAHVVWMLDAVLDGLEQAKARAED